jgi:hypothetical protein
VVPPARAVAITTAKATAMPQAVPPTAKRRRSFTGESRAAVEKGRADGPRRARRRTLEEASAAATAQASGAPSIWDDLEEDTRVLQAKPSGEVDDVIDHAFERLRTGSSDGGATAKPVEAPQSPGPDGEPKPAGKAAKPRPEPVPPAAPSQPTVVAPPPEAMESPKAHDGAKPSGPFAEEAMMEGPASQETKVWNQAPDMDGAGPATERPASIVDVAPVRKATGGAAPARAAGAAATGGELPARRVPVTPKRLGTIPALRVAVLATSIPGEVRLIALDNADEAPPGAALAVLVPLSAADGDSVSRLFGGLE